jgi:hypothetical protein
MMYEHAMEGGRRGFETYTIRPSYSKQNTLRDISSSQVWQQKRASEKYRKQTLCFMLVISGRKRYNDRLFYSTYLPPPATTSFLSLSLLSSSLSTPYLSSSSSILLTSPSTLLHYQNINFETRSETVITCIFILYCWLFNDAVSMETI